MEAEKTTIDASASPLLYPIADLHARLTGLPVSTEFFVMTSPAFSTLSDALFGFPFSTFRSPSLHVTAPLNDAVLSQGRLIPTSFLAVSPEVKFITGALRLSSNL